MKMKVAAGEHPWIDGWNRLLSDTSTLLSFGSHATANMGSSRQNASTDAHAAYNAVIRWYISGDTTYADKAVQICNAWSAVVNQVPSGTDIPGLSGIPIAEFAYVGELLRIYPGWAASDFDRFKAMMLNYWYPVAHDFLTRHNNACVTHYWANWDICNTGAIMAIGVLCDDQDKFNEAVDYYKNGLGAGGIMNAVYFIHPNGLGQWQESGRDQEHAQLGLGMMAAFCELAWHQGIDLYGYANNRLLAGAEYVARTTLNQPVPYTTYNNCDSVNQYFLAINGLGRLDDRPVWELLYNHYVVRQGYSAPNIAALANLTRPERGSVDHFGYGTLTFTLNGAASPYPAVPVPPAPANVVATGGVGRVELQWDVPADNSANGYTVFRATSAAGPFSSIGTLSLTTWKQFTDTGVTAGTPYYYQVQATNQTGTGPVSATVSATPTAAGATLAVGWANEDVGTVATPGSATYGTGALGNTFSIAASGTGVGGTADSFGFTYTGATGDVTVTARLVSIGGTLGKVGLMMRGSLAPDAPMIFVKLGDAGLREGGAGTRIATGANTSWALGNAYTWLPTWFKVARIGNTFTAYQSGDGTTWFPVVSSVIGMGDTCFVGMAATSGSTAVGTAVFDHVTVTGGGGVPAAPASVTATGVASRQIDVSWSASPGAGAYSVKRSSSASGPFSVIASGLGGTTFSDPGLAWSTTYYYVVSASAIGGESADSDVAAGTTLAPDIPPAPATLQAAAGNGRVVLGWSAATDATSYLVRRATVSGGPYAVVATVSGTSYTDSTVVNGTTYYYTVAGVNIGGTGPDSAFAAATPSTSVISYWPFDETSGTTAFDAWGTRNGTLSSAATWAPGALNNGVKLNGTSSSYVTLPTGVMSGLTDFTISAWVKLDASSTWMRLFDFGTGTTNYMFVTTRSNASATGIRYAIRTASVTERIIDGPAISGLGTWAHIAVTQSGTTAILYLNGQEVGRNTAMTLNPSSLGSTTLNYIGRSQFSADPYLNGTIDDFRIYNRSLSAGEIANVFLALAPATPTNVVAAGTAGNVAVSWNAVAGATSYTVKRATTLTGTYSTIATNVTTASYTDATATAGAYYYIVVARSGAFESASSSASSILLPPSMPVSVTAGGWNGRVDLAWAAATGAVAYDVKRATSAAGPFASIGSVATTTFTDTTVVNGSTYFYTVTGVNAAGTSVASAAVSATPTNAPSTDVWTHRDIGAVGISGNAGYLDGTYTVYGSGADIWTQTDSFQFLYQPLNGDGAIMARIVAQSTTAETAGAAKAGVMIRESLTAVNSRVALVDRTPNSVIEYIRRTATNVNATATTVSGNPLPRWVRLVRSGTTFTAYYSADGLTWTSPIGGQTIAMGTATSVGLVFCANANTKLGQATYDHVSIATAAPTITSATSAGGTVGVPFNYAIAATQNATLFTATGLPGGLALNADTGAISGTPTTAGTFSVTLTAINALSTGTTTLTLTIAKGAAAVSLDGLDATYDGTAKPVAATTAPAGLALDVTYAGASSAPIDAGTYAVVATVNDANYVGSATGALTIAKAAAGVTLGGLAATYDGAPKNVNVVTTPAGLPVDVTYDGSSTLPVNAGIYAVIVTVNSPNYTGGASGSLVIAKAAATVTLGSLSQTYDGAPKSATVTTNPASLPVQVTYDGSSTLPVNAGTYAVVATVTSPNYVGGASGSLVIAKAAATVTLGALNQTYDGTPKSATVTTDPANLPVLVTYDGSSTLPVDAGTYAVVATVASPNYVGGASGSLVIAKAAATVTLGALSQTYDGTPKSATVTTDPANLPVQVTYDGSSTLPVDAGTYAVVATVTSPNYVGGASGSLVIAKAAATVTLGALSQTYDGTPKSATATTNPAGLLVVLTYDGSATAPTNASSYTVVGVVNDPNYAGSATGTLTIGKAAATIALAPLAQRYDGSPKPVTATTTPANLSVKLTYDGGDAAPTYPGSHIVVATIDDSNYQGTATSTLVIGITALVRHAPTLNGDLDGSVQLLTGESFSLNGSSSVAGDLLLPGTPAIQLNGAPTVAGIQDGPGATDPANYSVTINHGAVLRYAIRHIDPIALPTVSAPPAPSGTRDVAINHADQSYGDPTTLRNLTLNSNAGTVALPPGTYGAMVVNGSATLVLGVAGGTEPAVYNLQSLTVNSRARVQLVGPVVLTLANGTTLNASVNADGAALLLTVRIAAGGLTLNGGATLHGDVLAPNGSVTINNRSTLVGSVSANYLTVNGTLEEPAE